MLFLPGPNYAPGVLAFYFIFWQLYKLINESKIDYVKLIHSTYSTNDLQRKVIVEMYSFRLHFLDMQLNCTIYHIPASHFLS